MSYDLQAAYRRGKYFLFLLILVGSGIQAQFVNSGGLYIAGNINITTGFTNNATAAYQNDGYLYVKGDFYNDQPFMTEGTGTTNFYGSALQKIAGSQSPDFHHVYLTNPAGVQMNVNVLMGGTISPVTGSLYFNNYALAMGGKINTAYTNTNAFSVTNLSDLIIYGNTSAGNSLYFDPSANTLHDLTINSGGAGTLGNALNITAGSAFGTVTATGTFNANNFLTLKSDANGTARVAKSPGTISNYVTVERYIPPRRSWRFMAVPITNDTLTIRTAWQEGVNNHDLVYADHQDPHPGYGTDITGDNDWSKGFDVNTTYNPSIKTWNPLISNWNSTAPPTISTVLSSNSAYCLFVRGSRAVHLEWATGAPADATVIRETGYLNNNTYTASYPSIFTGEYLFVGNPFASSINLSTVLNAAGTNGVSANKFWVWDPALNGSYGVGGYVTFDNGIYVPATNNYPNPPTTVIQGEQGFLVQSNATSATIQFKQNCKVSSENDAFKPAKVTKPHILINLMLHSADSLLLVDGTGVLFGDGFSNLIDENDAIKFPNFNESIAMLRFDRRMAIETRPMPGLEDTMFLKMTYLVASQPYALSILPKNFPASTTQAWLVDKYLKSMTALKLEDTTVYNFSTTADTTTFMRRFMIVYRKKLDATPVAVNRAIAQTISGNITVTPNPVITNKFEVVVSNVARGRYVAALYSADGKTIFTQDIEHPGGNASYTELLPSGTTAGVYTLSVTNRDGTAGKKISMVISRE